MATSDWNSEVATSSGTPVTRVLRNTIPVVSSRDKTLSLVFCLAALRLSDNGVNAVGSAGSAGGWVENGMSVTPSLSSRARSLLPPTWSRLGYPEVVSVLQTAITTVDRTV